MLTLHRNAFLSYVLLLTLTGADFYKTYDGYKILRVTLESKADYETIIALESGDFLEIFSEPSSKFLDILVAPKNIARCERVLKSQNLSVQVVRSFV